MVKSRRKRVKMAEKSYRQLKDDLDQVIAKLENGEADIDESVELYEAGQKLVAELEKYIKRSEAKIKKIS